MLYRGRTKNATVGKVTSVILASLLAFVLCFFCVGVSVRNGDAGTFGEAISSVFGWSTSESSGEDSATQSTTEQSSSSESKSASSKAATNAADPSAVSVSSKASSSAVAAGATESYNAGSITVTSSKRYKVTYEWEGAPDSDSVYSNLHTPVSISLPAQRKVRGGEELAINPLYEKGTTVYVFDKQGAISGWYTFSGWMHDGNLVSGSMTMPKEDVTLTGTWEYKTKSGGTVPFKDAHEVTYTWTGLSCDQSTTLYTVDDKPQVVSLPKSETCDKGNPYLVNETYYVGLTLYEHDANGYVCRSYTFSGWKISGKVAEGTQEMGDSDVTISGIWTHLDIEAPHVIRYEWTDAPDSSLELYDADENLVPIALPESSALFKDSSFTLDTTYTPGMELYRYSYDGYKVMTYTFNGWTLEGTEAPTQIVIGESDITICGTWTATMITYDVTYSWTWKDKDGNEIGAPDEAQVFYDVDGNVIDYKVEVPSALSKAPGAIVSVDTRFTDETVLYVHDEDGNVIGRYEFSGWDRQGEIHIGEEDVSITGEWTYYEEQE
jgi:hypothetical protein